MKRFAVTFFILVCAPALAQNAQRNPGSVTVTGGDALSTEHALSTIDFERHRYGNDVFMRAWVNKQSRAVEFQVYAVLESRGGVDPSAMNYLVGTELKSATTTRMQFDPQCSGRGCTIVEDVGATISPTDFAAIVATAAPLQVRFIGRTGPDVGMVIPAAELAALARAVEAIPTP